MEGSRLHSKVLYAKSEDCSIYISSSQRFSIGAHLKKKFYFASYSSLCDYNGDWVAVLPASSKLTIFLSQPTPNWLQTIWKLLILVTVANTVQVLFRDAQLFIYLHTALLVHLRCICSR